MNELKNIIKETPEHKKLISTIIKYQETHTPEETAREIKKLSKVLAKQITNNLN